MADAAWICGDPGIQYDTTINDWHTSANTDRIYASNPCSEYMFLNDTACNLASLNLLKFVGEDGEFDVEDYRYAARVTLTAQEILVDNASYPTPRIEENSHKFRPLGLGYANLGALLMSRGLAYDSPEGRNFAAGLTAIMHGEAYRQSAVIARDHGGPFLEYDVNRAPFLRVIGKHRTAAYALTKDGVPQEILDAAKVVYDEALELGKDHGYRNAQVTVLAPTGTIAFMMDCDTTGIEPDIALIKYKKLVGEGFLKIVNQTVPVGLKKLGYTAEQTQEILEYINEQETIEGAPHLKPERPPRLRLRVQAGQRRAVHPLHGPHPDDGCGPAVHQRRDQQDREHAGGRHGRGDRAGLPRGLEAGPQGDRDLPRQQQAQPAAQHRQEEGRGLRASSRRSSRRCSRSSPQRQVEAGKPHRRRLPAERTAVTHKFDIAGHEGYITVGLYPDGQPGEIFLKMAKEGSTVSGLMDSFATTVSVALQYGVPLRDLVNKFAHVRFEPSGFTGNSEIPIAKSIVDYIFRWLGSRFMTDDDKASLGLIDRGSVVDAPPSGAISFGSAPASVSAPVEAPAAQAPAPVIEPESKPSTDEPKASAVALDAARAAGREGRARLPGDRRRGLEWPLQRAHERPREWPLQRQCQAREWRRNHAEPRRHEGRLRHPGRRPVVHGLRLDHGSQRLLLQVPQLWVHLRLQLSPTRIRPDLRGPSSSTGPSHFPAAMDLGGLRFPRVLRNNRAREGADRVEGTMRSLSVASLRWARLRAHCELVVTGNLSSSRSTISIGNE